MRAAPESLADRLKVEALLREVLGIPGNFPGFERRAPAVRRSALVRLAAHHVIPSAPGPEEAWRLEGCLCDPTLHQRFAK